MSRTTLRIATRKSALAQWQAQYVADRLQRQHPEIATQLLPLSTRGDEVQNKPLAQVGGKALFLKELETAMLEGRADIAVHSLKDVPAELEADFSLGAILPRADASDAFVSRNYAQLEDLPPSARVGTSSLRRQAQLRGLRPDLQLLDLRGNVNTRLAKLERGEYDAIILATAGLTRLGLDEHIRSRLQAPQWLPSPGQGAIAVERRADDADTAEVLTALNDTDAQLTVRAERAMNRTLGGSCSVPVAAWCERSANSLDLQGLVGNVADGQVLRAGAQGPESDPEALGHAVAQSLLDQGAARFLEAAGQ